MLGRYTQTFLGSLSIVEYTLSTFPITILLSVCAWLPNEVITIRMNARIFFISYNYKLEIKDLLLKCISILIQLFIATSFIPKQMAIRIDGHLKISYK